jgi:hypothetical protein
MSKYETDEDGKTLPKPIVLTPEEAPQVAAGVGAFLSPSGWTIVAGGIIDILYGNRSQPKG